MINNHKKIILWTTADAESQMDVTSLAHHLKDKFEITQTKSYDELLQLCHNGPTALIITIPQGVSDSSEVFEQLKNKFPDILRFIFTKEQDSEALLELYKTQSIHKIIYDTDSIEFLSLQLHETSTLVDIISERNKFLELSITDPITQLTNHRFFHQKLQQELFKAKTYKESLSLLMIDVDHFKLLNDQFGHPKGDFVLSQIAKELKKHIPMNASASRYGGEEFAIVLPKTTTNKAKQIAESIRVSVSQLKIIDFRLSLSIGIASYPEHGLDADEIIATADQALYCAKRQGRNMSIVSNEISD